MHSHLNKKRPIPLAKSILGQIAAYSPVSVINNIIRLTRETIEFEKSSKFWLDILQCRGVVREDNIAASNNAMVLSRVYYRTNDAFGYILTYRGVIAFPDPINSFIVGDKHIWALTSDGKLYSKTLVDSYNQLVGLGDKWVITTVDEKIRQIRGLVDNDRIIAIGDDSIFVVNPLGKLIEAIGDVDDVDYYVQGSTVVNITNNSSVSLHSLDDHIVPVLFYGNIDKISSTIDGTKLLPAVASGNWSLVNIPHVVNGEPQNITDTYIGDPKQTHEERYVVYPLGDYDSEEVRDDLHEFDDSEYYGEGGGL